MAMLSSPLGVYLYLILRNDVSWALLTPQEKELILEANAKHNTQRSDYQNAVDYGAVRVEGGENWDSPKSRMDAPRGRILLSLLQRTRPQRVLEIGPGPGFYSRMICEFESVQYFAAVDIGQPFLDYLRPRLEKVREARPFNFNLICSDFLKYASEEKFDLIVLLSSMHHIPERENLISTLQQSLLPGGRIFCFDPSHYLPRIIRLTAKCYQKGYLTRAYYSKSENLSTHSFCTLGEYKRIIRRRSGLTVEETFFVPIRRLRKWNLLRWAWERMLSVEMGILLRKA